MQLMSSSNNWGGAFMHVKLVVQDPSLCANYLEAAFKKGIASPVLLHTELAHIYLRLALSEREHPAKGLHALAG